MKITKIFISIFLLAFLIGTTVYFLIPKTEKSVEQVEIVKIISANSSAPKVEFKAEPKLPDQSYNWNNEDNAQFKIKLLETGEGFHGNEINANSGEVWLGLFKINDEYFLRNTKIKIRRVEDAVVDEANQKTGKSVSVVDNHKPLFLMKNADMLPQSKILTLFCNPSEENLTHLENGFVKKYEINGSKYTLRVEGKENSSRLILESENTKQILYSLDKMGDTTWNLIWIGDLDGDGKLDLYANLPSFYNFSEHKLFLSTQAENGKLVKQIANFWTSGC